MNIELVVAIVGVILGAWINNRVNWKINDRIKNLDYMTDAIFKMQFYIMKSNSGQTDYEDNYINAMATFVKTSNILLDEITLKKISDATLRSMLEYNKEKTETAHKHFEGNLEKMHLCIHITRNKISSFHYMWKQLIPRCIVTKY